MRDVTIKDFLNVCRKKGYKLFYGGRGINLNIWGIRSIDRSSNTFNDKICAFWKNIDTDEWRLIQFDATTDPGLYWRNNPMNQLGTAILKPGQYEGCWKIGKHKGYEALVQDKPVVVHRDNNRDNILDIENPNVDIHAGVFGINIHRANSNGKSVQVDRWSAGCQVLQNRRRNHTLYGVEFQYDWDFFMYLVKYSASFYNEYFTYTLIDETDLLDE
ncbi:MAG: hypothetical protein KDC09_12635 [Bacteroidales bacterium]|nr:hypothetical protein [Bacteroidales bacterium]